MGKLTEFRADSDYSLWLRFDDGLEGSVFLGNLLEIGAFKIWRDQDQFRRVAIDPAAMTLVWDGGIELDPAVLYRDLLERKAAQGRAHTQARNSAGWGLPRPAG
jgi:Protein of unknown function (DUF2442)